MHNRMEAPHVMNQRHIILRYTRYVHLHHVVERENDELQISYPLYMAFSAN